MKKIFLLLTLILFFFAAGAQTADLEVVGFADENGERIYSIVMNSTQDLQPRVIVKNNGSSAVAATDSIIFDITYNQNYPITYLYIAGSQLNSAGVGEEMIVDLVHPIWTAAIMDEFQLIACSICYDVRISGVTTDPNPDNNKACIDMTRTIDIEDAEIASVSMFPNPASSAVTLSGVAGSQVQLFDLSGRRLFLIESAEENQQLDVSSLAEGLYIVRISDGGRSVVQKLNVIR